MSDSTKGPPMATKSYDTIRYEVDGHKATITLNRPDALNALSPFMITELRDAYDAAENDDDVWLLIVTGAGRAFCTGADAKQIPGDGKVINERAYLSTYDQWEAPRKAHLPFAEWPSRSWRRSTESAAARDSTGSPPATSSSHPMRPPSLIRTSASAWSPAGRWSGWRAS